MGRKLPTEGRFRCDGCNQPYDVPPATVTAIRKHLRETHGVKRDKRWVQRRLAS